MRNTLTFLLLLCSNTFLLAQLLPTTVWTGMNSTDWFDSTNWTAGLPNVDTTATIPTSVLSLRFPVLTDDFTIEEEQIIYVGGQLTFDGNLLTNLGALHIWEEGQLINNGIFNNEKNVYVQGELLNRGVLKNMDWISFSGTIINEGNMVISSPMTRVNGVLINRSEAVIDVFRSRLFAFTGYFDDREGKLEEEDCSFVIIRGDRSNFPISNTSTAKAIYVFTDVFEPEPPRVEGEALLVDCVGSNVADCLQNISTDCVFKGTIAAETYWTGAVDTTFQNAANWTAGVPDFFHNAVIPATVPSNNFPTIKDSLAINFFIRNKGNLTIAAPVSLSNETKFVNQGQLKNLSTYRSIASISNDSTGYIINQDTLSTGIYNLGVVDNYGVLENASYQRELYNSGKITNYQYWNLQYRTDNQGIMENFGRMDMYTNFKNDGVLINQTSTRSDGGVYIRGGSYFSNNNQIKNFGIFSMMSNGRLILGAASQGTFEHYGQLTTDTRLELSLGNNFITYPNSSLQLNGKSSWHNPKEIPITNHSKTLTTNNLTFQGAFVHQDTITNTGLMTWRADSTVVEVINNSMVSNEENAKWEIKKLSLVNNGRMVNESCARIEMKNIRSLQIGDFHNAGDVLIGSNVPDFTFNQDSSGDVIRCANDNFGACFFFDDCFNGSDTLNFWTGNKNTNWFEEDNWMLGIPRGLQTAIIPKNPTGRRFPIVVQRGNLNTRIVNYGKLTFSSLTNLINERLINKPEASIEITVDATIAKTGDSTKALVNQGLITNNGVMIVNGWILNYNTIRSNKRVSLGGFTYCQNRGCAFVPSGFVNNYGVYEGGNSDTLQIEGIFKNYQNLRLNHQLYTKEGYLYNLGKFTLAENAEATLGFNNIRGRGFRNEGETFIAGQLRSYMRFSNDSLIYILPCAIYRGGGLGQFGNGKLINQGGLVDRVNLNMSRYEEQSGYRLTDLNEGTYRPDLVSIRGQPANIRIDSSGIFTLQPEIFQPEGTVSQCDSVRFTVSPNALSCNDIGIQFITLKAYDLLGNYDSTLVQLNVAGSVGCGANAITTYCHNNISRIQNRPNGFEFDYPYTVSGQTNCPLEKDIRIDGIQTLGPDLEGVIPVGDQEIEFTFTDRCGNQSTCRFTLSIEPKSFGSTCPDNITVTALTVSNQVVVDYPEPMIEMLCNPQSLSLNPNLPSGSTFNVGTTNLFYDGEDVCGNQYGCSFQVTVLPFTPTVAGIDLQLAMRTANPQPPRYSEVPFTIILTNFGDQDAREILVSLPIPEGMVYTASDADNGYYNDYSGQWEIYLLRGGTTATLDLVLYVLEDANTIPVYAQVAAMQGVDVDSTPNNGTCCTPEEDDEAVVFLYPELGLRSNIAPIRTAILELTPSPVQDILRVSTALQGGGQLEIMDMQGRVLKTKTISDFSTPIQVQDLASGVYLVVLKQADRVEVSHFVKTD